MSHKEDKMQQLHHQFLTVKTMDTESTTEATVATADLIHVFLLTPNMAAR